MCRADPPDHLAALATRLGVERSALADVVPSPLELATLGRQRSDGSRTDNEEVGWFRAGEPVLVLIGVGPGSELAVACPKVSWDGQTRVVVAAEPVRRRQAGGTSTDLRHWLTESIASITGVRRGTFRRCERCGAERPPE